MLFRSARGLVVEVFRGQKTTSASLKGVRRQEMDDRCKVWKRSRPTTRLFCGCLCHISAMSVIIGVCCSSIFLFSQHYQPAWAWAGSEEWKRDKQTATFGCRNHNGYICLKELFRSLPANRLGKRKNTVVSNKSKTCVKRLTVASANVAHSALARAQALARTEQMAQREHPAELLANPRC